MEYAVRLSSTAKIPVDPRHLCSSPWRELLPPAPLTAIYFGTEFCEDLLPSHDEVSRFCDQADDAGIAAVLLTPVVSVRGLKRLESLLTSLRNQQKLPAIVANDWGVLHLLCRSYPEFRRRVGRLFNRSLRDPRLTERINTCDAGETQGVSRMHSLLARMEVEAIETDVDLQGNFLGVDPDPFQRVLHLPYVFTASGRNCLVKADGVSADNSFTHGLGHVCPGRCRDRVHLVERSDTTLTLWRSGNTIFYEAPRFMVEPLLSRADCVVLHERPQA
ncbi:MAG: hypothetical protein WCD00_14895 [Desulfuromonadaceae bacterium]